MRASNISVKLDKLRLFLLRAGQHIESISEHIGVGLSPLQRLELDDRKVASQVMDLMFLVEGVFGRFPGQA